MTSLLKSNSLALIYFLYITKIFIIVIVCILVILQRFICSRIIYRGKIVNNSTPSLGILVVGSREISCLRLMNIYSHM